MTVGQPGAEYRLTGESVPRPIDPSDLLGLDLQAQKRLVLAHATNYAGDDALRLGEIARLTPGYSIEGYELGRKILDSNQGPLARLWALRDLSLTHGPFSYPAWEEAVKLAETTKYTDWTNDPPHAFEVIIGGQTHPHRLDSMVRLAFRTFPKDRITRSIILAAVAKQQVPIDIKKANLTRNYIPYDPETGFFDTLSSEVLLVMAEHFARNGQENFAYERVLDASPHMQPWGAVKISKYINVRNAAEHIDEGLRQHWNNYRPRQQIQIIRDLAGAGRFDLGQELAFRQHDENCEIWRRFGSRTMRKSGELIIELAQSQAQSDLPGGLALLERLQEETLARLNAAIAASKNISPEPVGGRSPVRDNKSEQEVHGDILDAISMHRTALLVVSDPEEALRRHHRMTGLLEDRSVYKEISRQVMGDALARAGLTEQALAVVAKIDDYDPLARQVKAQVLISIARSLQRRIVAGHTGSAPITTVP